MTDKEFLGYVDLHSRTERAAFQEEDVRRLVRMAGADKVLCYPCGLPGFVSLYHDEAEPLIKAARKRLR